MTLVTVTPTPIPVAVAPAKLVVTARPGVSVSIDGKPAIEGPFGMPGMAKGPLDLKPGKHSLVFTYDSQKFRAEKMIEVRSGDRIHFHSDAIAKVVSLVNDQ